MSIIDVVNLCAPGHYDPYDSYGLIACQLARHLAGMGVYVNALALGESRHANQPDDLAIITRRPVRATLGGILLGYPTTYRRHGALVMHGPRVALTMFESSKLPPAWAPLLNQCDAVIVPSWFCWEVFRQSGVKAPIHVVPLGVSETYAYAERKSNRPFTFLAFLDRGRRKGGLAALNAFLTAFGDDPSYRLILKSRTPRVKVELMNPNITLIQRDMTEQELYELYLQADVLVNANMGEGFGLIPREFAATGGISLATDWGGTADDLDLWGVPLPYRLVQADWAGAKGLEGLDLGVWAEPDMGGVAQMMRQVAEEREERRAQARLAARVVRQLYDWRRFAAQVLEIWREAVHGYRHRAAA